MRIAEVAQGKDPASALREIRSVDQSTVYAALEGYKASLTQRRVVNVPTIMSALRRGLAALRRREVSSLSRADYVGAINSIERTGKFGAAEYLRKKCRTFAEWLVTQGWAPHNPLAGLRRPKATRADRLETEEGGRALRDPEIAVVWHARQHGSEPFASLVRFGLLTGIRRGELANLKWSDVAHDRIVLEAEKTKQGRRHEIPLTDLMREVIHGLPRGSSHFVFGSWKTGRPMSGWSKMLPKLAASAEVEFTLHDLRRTCRTLMTNLGVSVEVAEIAIGHQKTGLVRRYDFSELWHERKIAFEKVSAHIAALTGHKKVVALPVRRGH